MSSGTNDGASAQALPADALARWNALFRAHRVTECEALARQLASDHPGAAKAWQLLGMSCFARNDLAAAREHLRHAAALGRGDRSIWDNLGVVLRKCGEHAAAREAFRAAIALAPSAGALWSNAAGNEFEAGNHAAALRLASRAVELAPGLAAAWLQLGNALGRLGRHAEAESALRRSLGIAPGSVEALLSLGTELAAQQRLQEACTVTTEAVRLAPGHSLAHINLGSLHDRLGDIDAARRHYRRARELEPANLGSWSSELYCLSHDASADPREVFAAHRAFGDYVDARFGAQAAPHANDRDPARPLRVGVLSGDLRDHPVARFLEPVWRELDPAAVRLVAYDTSPATDALALRLRELAHEWVDVSKLSDDAIAARIRADAIDVLIDHSGHTARNRLPVFARRPAPVQVMWFGYPGTSGLHSIDYRLVDAMLAPPGRLDHLFTERLAYLPSMLVFGRPEQLPSLSPSPLARNGHITYGSFNRMNKLGDDVIAGWIEILQRVPDARLVIGAVSDEARADALRARFAAAGIVARRLDFLPRLGMGEYLAAHREIDLLLDAFPWTSSTTAHFGLWMGVPTVTRAGESLVARLGAASMAAAGLEEFVAESAAEYVAISVRAAARPDDLQRIRAGLRSRLEEDARRVPAQVARTLERRLRQMWQRWCAGLPACVLD